MTSSLIMYLNPQDGLQYEWVVYNMSQESNCVLCQPCLCLVIGPFGANVRVLTTTAVRQKYPFHLHPNHIISQKQSNVGRKNNTLNRATNLWKKLVGTESRTWLNIYVCLLVSIGWGEGGDGLKMPQVDKCQKIYFYWVTSWEISFISQEHTEYDV